MYNNRIFYSCDYLNILNRYLTDIGYNVDYANISKSLHLEMNNSLDILKLLPLIGVTSHPLTRYGLSSIQINDRYYTSMTVYDIRKILKMENDQEIINQVKMIAYNYPSQFFEDNSNPKYSKFRINTSKIYKDSRDDVLFLVDLQRFDFELASSLDENVTSVIPYSKPFNWKPRFEPDLSILIIFSVLCFTSDFCFSYSYPLSLKGEQGRNF